MWACINMLHLLELRLYQELSEDVTEAWIGRPGSNTPQTLCAPPSQLFPKDIDRDSDPWATPSATLVGSLSPRSSFLPGILGTPLILSPSPLSHSHSPVLSPSLLPEVAADSTLSLSVNASGSKGNLGAIRNPLKSTRSRGRVALRNTGGVGKGNSKGRPAKAAQRQCRRGGQAAQARPHTTGVGVGPEQLGVEERLEGGDPDEELQPTEGYSGGPVPEVLPLSAEAIPVLGALARAARDFIYRSAGLEVPSIPSLSGLVTLVTNVPAVMTALIHGQATSQPAIPSHHLRSNDFHILVALVERCKDIEMREACLQLTYLVNSLMLAAQINRYKIQKSFDLFIDDW